MLAIREVARFVTTQIMGRANDLTADKGYTRLNGARRQTAVDAWPDLGPKIEAAIITGTDPVDCFSCRFMRTGDVLTAASSTIESGLDTVNRDVTADNALGPVAELADAADLKSAGP